MIWYMNSLACSISLLANKRFDTGDMVCSISNSIHRDSFFVVRDLVKLSPIPINQQQFPFGNAQQNATWSCSGIIEVEVPPSFLDLPSPQVKSWEQPTADMTRHIQCIAETLSHGTATESSPTLHSEGYAFKENRKETLSSFWKSYSNMLKQTIKKKKKKNSWNSSLYFISVQFWIWKIIFYFWWHREDNHTKSCPVEIYFYRNYFTSAAIYFQMHAQSITEVLPVIP